MRIDPGKVAEYEFAAEVLKRNLIPCWPSTAHIPFDVIVTGSRPVKVQVKGALTDDRGTLKVSLLRNQQKPYGKGDFDFLVIRAVDSNLWYIIPGSEVIGFKGIRLNPLSHRCRFRRYLNAWRLLEDAC